ncbi:hypothetical protein ACFOOM_28185 [Streptomyces echinoruber]|uniref:AMIN-like domain-containing (lipo)protein n=1 Tax=Streptomyces echinoruber TaxID=68898 RepID=UPI0036217CCA
MQHRSRRTAIAAALTLTATTGAVVPAVAAPQAGASPQVHTTALVVNARWSGHCAYDRVVIDVRGTMPPVTVKPVKKLRYDASGQRVPLPGRHFLQIRLSPAAAHTQSGRPVYKGPRLVKIHLPQLRGLALTGDFEGVVTFGLAFRHNPHYTVHTLHSPERFVLDVRHADVCR